MLTSEIAMLVQSSGVQVRSFLRCTGDRGYNHRHDNNTQHTIASRDHLALVFVCVAVAVTCDKWNDHSPLIALTYINHFDIYGRLRWEEKLSLESIVNLPCTLANVSLIHDVSHCIHLIERRNCGEEEFHFLFQGQDTCAPRHLQTNVIVMHLDQLIMTIDSSAAHTTASFLLLHSQSICPTAASIALSLNLRHSKPVFEQEDKTIHWNNNNKSLAQWFGERRTTLITPLIHYHACSLLHLTNWMND